jgi:CAAX protease family protein
MIESAEKLDPRQRALSLIELLVGGAIVIAHNVFHAVPNEVPILFAFGVGSIWLRARTWRAIGFTRPKSWPLTVGVALIAAIATLAFGEFVTEPLAKAVGLHENSGAAAHALGTLRGHPWSAFKGLAIVWTFAAFGEEVSYRRYLLGRAAEAAGGTTLAYFMIGAVYLLMKRDLWVAVLTHGLIDTIGIGLLFFGLAN